MCKKSIHVLGIYTVNKSISYEKSLSDLYFNLTPEERETWIVGEDIKQTFYKIAIISQSIENEKYSIASWENFQRHYNIVFPHAMYINTYGQLISVFIKTPSVNSSRLDDMCATCKFMDSEVIVLKRMKKKCR